MYTEVKTIGEGGFGKVVKVTKDGKEYAKKVCTRSREKYHYNTIIEKEFMELLETDPSHPGYSHVVHLVDSIQNGIGYDLIMELYEGDLYTMMENTYYDEGEWHRKGLEESIVRDIALHVSRGLAYMKRLGYAHCDLKPENILWRYSPTSESGYHFSISDFGNVMNQMSEYYVLQAPSYRSAENILGSCSIDSCDIPSLGFILYEAITGTVFSKKTNSKDHLERTLDAIGYQALEKCNTDELPMIQPYLKNVLVGMGTLKCSFSELNESFKKMDYTKRTEMVDLISSMWIPFPLQRIQANEIGGHSVFQ